MSELIQTPPGPAFELNPDVSALLSAAGSKRGRLQRAALALLLEHESAGMLPTNGRFLFYEAEQRGIVSKTRPSARGRRGDQDLIDALKWLRDTTIVPWGWLVDETRTLDEWRQANTVAEYLIDAIDQARINPWDGEPPPLILCESRSLKGVLRAIAAEYLCPIAATNGQAGGFLHTDLTPLLAGNERRVLYLGDHDLCGDQIERNTQRVLEQTTGRAIDWERLAITAGQVEERQLEPILKKDARSARPGSTRRGKPKRSGRQPSPLSSATGWTNYYPNRSLMFASASGKSAASCSAGSRRSSARDRPAPDHPRARRAARPGAGHGVETPPERRTPRLPARLECAQVP